MMFVLPYPPSANAYWRSVRGRVLVSAEARAYKQKVQLLAKKQRGHVLWDALTAGPVAVTISVYRPRKIGDLDNTLKVLLDALKGVAFEDDSQVVELIATRSDDAANPRVVVTVEAA